MRNCHSCGHDRVDEFGHTCDPVDEDPEVQIWAPKDSDMPPEDADGCPGWTPKEDDDG